MFNTTKAFKRQFIRTEGGYLIFPSRKLGAKLVTEAEYDQLLAEWESVAGRAGRWKTVGAVCAIVALWTLVSDWLSFSESADSLLTAAVVVTILARLLWSSTAPRRLVKGRPSVAPPRLPAQARREARAALSWPIVITILLISGLVFLGSIITLDRSASAWAWLIGSGALLGLYLWVGLKKLSDGRS
ncbi:hypothetical protein [Sphingomonas aerophila]|jgi:hypothetical protein|uniref:Uncharacterized protein n=1 Tax=Sphingomonas aerophila TaxID=1344948 RepID=A0A7W9B9Q7_9SPHN|nr:hypothetical protein [Sphingomonas aerophila]MBB5713221.1 hypothetical protein [Sphingomonas aerophila]